MTYLWGYSGAFSQDLCSPLKVGQGSYHYGSHELWEGLDLLHLSPNSNR